MPRDATGSILPHPAVFAATFAVTALAWSAAGLLWSAGQRSFAVSAFLLGLSLGPLLTAYATAPRAQKHRQRRLVLFAGGLSILAPALLAGLSLDLEGCFALLLAGTAGAAVGQRWGQVLSLSAAVPSGNAEATTGDLASTARTAAAPSR